MTTADAVNTLHLDQARISGLALRVAVIVASILSLSDAVALIPTSASLSNWIFKIVGIWFIALILCYVSLFAILLLLSTINKGITFKKHGLKLGQFERCIEWSKIKAIALEPQPLFSRIFFYTPCPARLILFFSRSTTSKLSHKDIPSLYFQQQDFSQLVAHVCQQTLGFVPSGQLFVASADGDFAQVKSELSKLRWQRILLSLLIAVGLIIFLTRKAAVYRLYNMGNQSVIHSCYSLALTQYQGAVALEPGFAAAWHNLAGAEFYLGKIQDAEKHWHKALLLKPDMVEPKVSLAFLAMKKRNFADAQALLNKARETAPEDLSVRINLAELNMRLGHIPAAMRIAQFILAQDKSNCLATCLLAQGRIYMGKPQEALKLLNRLPNLPATKNAYCQLVRGEAYTALGQADKAAQIFAHVLKQYPDNVDALLNLADLHISQGRLKEAHVLLEQATRADPTNPWIYLRRAKLYLKLQDKDKAAKLFRLALIQQGSYRNPIWLTELAEIALTLGKTKEAASLAKEAQKLREQHYSSYNGD